MNIKMAMAATSTATSELEPTVEIREAQPRSTPIQDSSSPQTQGKAPLPMAPGPSRRVAAPDRKQLLMASAIAAVIAVIAFAGYRRWDYSRTWVKTDNAYVTAHIHQVSSRVAGTVQEVLVEDNQAVEAGAIIARLDRRDLEVRRQHAQAQVAQAHAQLEQAEAQIAQAKAQVTREEAHLAKAQRDLERAKALSQGASGAISRQEFDDSQTAADTARAGLEAAQSALKSAGALSAAARAQEQVAQATLRDAELQLTYTDLVAPAAGRVGRKNLETGNRVQPGQALLALVQPDAWIIANFKETQLTHLKPGQTVRLQVDAFPGRVFTGKVESLGSASGAQFALLPPDNATGNFTKIVQRIPVKVLFDSASLGDCEGRIVAGMSTVVEVKVR